MVRRILWGALAFLLLAAMAVDAKQNLEFNRHLEPGEFPVEYLNKRFTSMYAFTLYEDLEFPLVFTPRSRDNATAAAVVNFIKDHHEAVHEEFYKRGAVLFRGFDIPSAVEFEKVALELEPNLDDHYLGTSPRKLVEGTKHVFTASEFPYYVVIPQHAEMSFIKDPPKRLFFFALDPNAGLGGETPLTDFRQVWRDMSDETKEAFVEGKVRNIRHYVDGSNDDMFNVDTIDYFKTKSWQEMFATDDRTEAEEQARSEGFEVEWKKRGLMKLTNTQHPTRVHPVTGDETWHCHIGVLHADSIPMEYGETVRRVIEHKKLTNASLWDQILDVDVMKYRFLHVVSTAMVVFMSFVMDDEDLGQQTTHENGVPILPEHLDELRELVWRNTASYNHQKGDMVMIDNYRLAHGRQPYTGPRKVLVAWS